MQNPITPAAPAARIAPKTAEILDRIKSVFVQKGFEGASMQDLALAAGMSAGNFYRYFPSKNAIVEAIVARDLEEVEQAFAAIMEAPDARLALREGLRRHLTDSQETDDGSLWAEIEAASARRPEIAEISNRMGDSVLSNLVRVFARISSVPEDEAARRYMTHAELMMMLIKGSAMSSCAMSRLHASLSDRSAFNALVLDLADHVIDRIVADAANLQKKA